MKKIYLLLLTLTGLFILIIVCIKFNKWSFHNSVQDNPLPPIDTTLLVNIDSFITENMPEGKLGLMVYDITARKEVYSYSKDSLMSPASCMKLLTCITLLKYYEPDFSLYNELYYTGKITNDTLDGNLILKTDFDTFFNRDTLNQMIDTLSNMGIKTITGDILADMRFYEQMEHEKHWIIGDLHTKYMGLVLQGFPYTQKHLAGALKAKGISFDVERIKPGKLDKDNSILIARNKNTMHSLIEKALNVSSNINAEAMLYPLSLFSGNSVNMREGGKQCLRDFIAKDLGITQGNSYNIDDGCGLCPNDKLSASHLVSLLVYAFDTPYIYDEIINDMPLSGINGTLYKRMQEDDIIGRICAKTGTLTRDGGVATLAGYFIGKNDHLIAFAILNNGCTVEKGRDWQDNFCRFALKPQRMIGNAEMIIKEEKQK